MSCSLCLPGDTFSLDRCNGSKSNVLLSNSTIFYAQARSVPQGILLLCQCGSNMLNLLVNNSLNNMRFFSLLLWVLVTRRWHVMACDASQIVVFLIAIHGSNKTVKILLRCFL